MGIPPKFVGGDIGTAGSTQHFATAGADAGVDATIKFNDFLPQKAACSQRLIDERAATCCMTSPSVSAATIALQAKISNTSGQQPFTDDGAGPAGDTQHFAMAGDDNVTPNSTNLTTEAVGHGVLYTSWKGIQQHHIRWRSLPLWWHALATNEWIDHASMEDHAGLDTWPQEWAPFLVVQHAVPDDFCKWWYRTRCNTHWHPNYMDYKQGADRVMYEVWKGTLDNTCFNEWAYMTADKRQETAQKVTYERRESARLRQKAANHQRLLVQRAAHVREVARQEAVWCTRRWCKNT